MSKYFEVRWHGRGGQGAVTGAKSLADCVQGTGRNVVAFPEYGPERRGAPVKAFNRFADKYIRIHTPVYDPDVVIVIDASLLTLPAVKDGLKPETIFIVNTEQTPDAIKKILGVENTVYTVPANDISIGIFGRPIPNSATMGAFARACGEMITVEKMVDEADHVFSELLGPELVEKNLKAIQAGFEQGECA